MKEIRLTQGKTTIVSDRVFEYLNRFSWQVRKNRKVWYAVRQDNNKTIYMHREITKAPKGYTVDHIDGNGLNNVDSNLRVCSDSQNKSNMTKYSNNKSGYKGVSLERKTNKWIAQIQINGNKKYLGTFTNKEDAARRYDEEAKKIHGEFANLNF